MIVVCKKYYIETLVNEFGINTSSNTNSIYVPCTESFDGILRIHANFVSSLGLEMSVEDKNLPYLYCTPKLHKTPFKHRFIAGSSKCTTKGLSSFLTKLLSTVKEEVLFQGYKVNRLRNGFQRFYGRNPDIVAKYQKSET